ncbi:MAG: cell division protein ZapA [Saccharofermentans sp.]|jgi:hypothetical protein|nr:cell division protein ZapA [Mageeibacillus sp.]MCI1264036.1 cell division protein ZapA [Saccharofermentans sp.]MCI1275448.1 cell division protein ZapA [Saccharofermentans sp.]MCI1769613.1 cell division protein ZapA [Mageeibacillus sp.]MCI2044038.1 cell division protein ZapA [Mageeibacillus sp.]
MKKSNSSILGKYSDGSYRKKNTKSDLPPMVEYKQLYKGEIQSKTVTEKKVQTLEERIAARTRPAEEDVQPKEVEARVTIGGVSYLVKSDDATSERIIKVGELAAEIYDETRKSNPYIATLKTAVLSLFECCDRLLTLRSENNVLKTELMYYKQKDQLNNESKERDSEPTPVEKLAITVKHNEKN